MCVCVCVCACACACACACVCECVYVHVCVSVCVCMCVCLTPYCGLSKEGKIQCASRLVEIRQLMRGFVTLVEAWNQ